MGVKTMSPRRQSRPQEIARMQDFAPFTPELTPRRKEAGQARLAIRYAGCRASTNFGVLLKMNYY